MEIIDVGKGRAQESKGAISGFKSLKPRGKLFVGGFVMDGLGR